MNVADRSSFSPRFVLLRHEMPANHPVASHWDLMLEQPKGLYTLRLSNLPVAERSAGIAARAAQGPASDNRPADQQSVAFPATRLADHRQKYLEHEGPVSGDRGQVRAVARGIVAVDTTDASPNDVCEGVAVEVLPPAANFESPATDFETAVTDFGKGALITLTTADGCSARLLLPACRENQNLVLTVYQWSLP